MREVLAELTAAVESRRSAAYCRLVETRGSTPQKAGATMLVYPDGSQAGTLGGGCVEAEVKRRAIAALNDGAPQVATFQLDSDYGWDDGLICGGRMKILIQPLTADSQPYYRAVAETLRGGSGATEAIAFDAPAGESGAPASLLFDQHGALVASLGHAASLESIGAAVRPLADRPRPYAEQGVAFLPVLPRCRLVIVGGGHVGQAVGALAVDLDFDLWVIDDREEYTSAERFPRAQQRITGEIEAVLPKLEITSDTYCLIVTRGHGHDERALFHLADRGARYVGLIGSRRKIKLIFEDLLAEGVSAEALERVYAPLGIDIGSQTVPEIAISICAELVAHRNTGHVPGRPRAVAAGGAA